MPSIESRSCSDALRSGRETLLDEAPDGGCGRELTDDELHALHLALVVGTARGARGDRKDPFELARHSERKDRVEIGAGKGIGELEGGWANPVERLRRLGLEVIPDRLERAVPLSYQAQIDLKQAREVGLYEPSHLVFRHRDVLKPFGELGSSRA